MASEATPWVNNDSNKRPERAKVLFHNHLLFICYGCCQPVYCLKFFNSEYKKSAAHNTMRGTLLFIESIPKDGFFVYHILLSNVLASVLDNDTLHRLSYALSSNVVHWSLVVNRLLNVLDAYAFACSCLNWVAKTTHLVRCTY